MRDTRGAPCPDRCGEESCRSNRSSLKRFRSYRVTSPGSTWMVVIRLIRLFRRARAARRARTSSSSPGFGAADRSALGSVVSVLLVVLGLIISIPIVVGGSQLIGKLMEKYPVLVVIGAAILGWTGGTMIVHDRTIGPMILGFAPQAETLIPAALAGIVCSIGGRRQRSE